MALNENATKELLAQLVGSHHFPSADVKDRAQELLDSLDTPQNDQTEADAAAKAEEEARAAQEAEDAAFADAVRRYNESHPQEPKAE